MFVKQVGYNEGQLRPAGDGVTSTDKASDTAVFGGDTQALPLAEYTSEQRGALSEMRRHNLDLAKVESLVRYGCGEGLPGRVTPVDLRYWAHLFNISTEPE